MAVALTIPAKLAANCAADARARGLARAAAATRSGACSASGRSVSAPPFDGDEVSAALGRAGHAGRREPAVLKLGMPHMEAEHEIDGLRFWDGDPTVRLLEADRGPNAMLLERCEPGTVAARAARARAGRRDRRAAPPALAHGAGAAPVPPARRDDRALERRDARAIERVARSRARRARACACSRSCRALRRSDVLLATDLHAGNVLRAQREPWLVIDPKPFVGDPGLRRDAASLQLRAPVRRARWTTVRRFADLLELDHERVRLWTFARTARRVAATTGPTTLPSSRARARLTP